MIVVLAAAVGCACGFIGLVAALRPRQPSLVGALAALDELPAAPTTGRHGSTRPPQVRIDLRLGARLATVVDEQDYVRTRLRPLFAITAASIQQLCGEVVLGAGVGLVLPGLIWLIFEAGGVHLAFIVPLWAGLVVGAGGALAPVLVLRSRARRARRNARKVVGSFLNLVVLCLAGGMGIESALHASAAIRQNEISDRILNALVLAQDAGEPPWETLGRLGRDLGLTELTELAAAVGLAGTEGARIRVTLAAKAGSIRRHELAEAEGDANRVTERLFFPGVFLLVGFLVFISYPAIARISSGL
jgi:Flp pilus assembly protein TadB